MGSSTQHSMVASSGEATPPKRIARNTTYFVPSAFAMPHGGSSGILPYSRRPWPTRAGPASAAKADGPRRRARPSRGTTLSSRCTQPLTLLRRMCTTSRTCRAES